MSEELSRRRLRRLVWKLPVVLALVSFAVWWQWKIENQGSVGNTQKQIHSIDSTSLAGAWGAEVTYESGERHSERFFFQPEGERLYGTASFRGRKFGIEDGKINGARVSFTVKFEEMTDGATRERWNRYEGQIAGREVHLKLIDDKGSPPVAFLLVKNGAAAGDESTSKR